MLPSQQMPIWPDMSESSLASRSQWSEKHMAETGEIYKDLSGALGQLTGELRGSMSTAAEEPEVRARMEKVNKAAGDLFRRPRARD